MQHRSQTAARPTPLWAELSAMSVLAALALAIAAF